MLDFFQRIKEGGDRIAFRYFQGDDIKEVSYIQYYNDICECLENIKEEFGGSVNNLHIASILPNSYENIVLISAAILGGAVMIPLNYLETVENQKQMISDSDAEILILEDSNTDYFGDIKVVFISKVCSFDRIKQFHHKFDMENEDKLALIVYSSGTTGKAKGAMISLKSLFYREMAFLPKEYYLDDSLQDVLVTYLVFPLYHISGVRSWISWCTRGCLTFINQNIGSTLLELEKIKIDFTYAPPALMKLWQKALKRGGTKAIGEIKSICTAGAPIEKRLIEYYLDNGINYTQVYGMTECFGYVTYNYDMTDHIESVGRRIPESELKIVDGEICIKSWSNMLGYYNDEKATKECIVDGFVHSGDLGYIDEEGYLYITGRKKNTIILSGGENVNPEEIERILYDNSKIKECILYEKNDRIVAGIYADEGDYDEIKVYVRKINAELPIFKRIHKIVFSENEFPKTSSGKIRRMPI